MINVLRGIGFIAAIVYFICQFTSLVDNQAVEKVALVVILVSVLFSFLIPDKKKEEKS